MLLSSTLAAMDYNMASSSASGSSSSSGSGSSSSGQSWQLPKGHFLAQAQQKLLQQQDHSLPHYLQEEQQQQQQNASSSSSSQPVIPPPTVLPDTSTLAGADFDVDVRSGFLPPEAPLSRLPDELPESTWETALDAARSIDLKLNSNQADHRAWRAGIREMQIIHSNSTPLSNDIRYARRAHVVLTFLAHYYIHSQPQPTTSINTTPVYNAADVDSILAHQEAMGMYAARLPPSISIPLLRISSQLDIPPILTYADTVLWNWHLKQPSLGLIASNIAITETFSSTVSEEHFYLTSLLIELRGVAALDVMRVCLDECFMGDALAKKRITKYLNSLSLIIDDLQVILKNVRTDCDPATFYWGIRPWFRGGDSSPFEQKGWHYEQAHQQQGSVPRLFTGPSAGQSSLIHALDVFMDVDHTGLKPRSSRGPLTTRPVSTTSNDARPVITADATTLPPDATFMQRMQLYMPGQHRKFLTHLQSLSSPEDDEYDLRISPLRTLTQSTLSSNPHHSLPKAYNTALQALKSLRDEHMRVATLYIISQATKQPPLEYFIEDEKKDDEKARKGTGGTDLVLFLKSCRSNTLDALLQ
ncbi:unnamed protein product [Sympodiomycopsis kandeliae]